MKLVRKKIIAKNDAGSVTLLPEDGEDLWHAYNLICVGDEVTATAIRKVVKETATCVSSDRIRMKLTIKVVSVDFDPLDFSIRLSGTNVCENAHVRLGAHHTLELEPHRQFTVAKNCWDIIVLERLTTACDPAKQASIAAVVMDKGLANVCLISGFMTIVRARLEKSIPKKRAITKAHDDAMKRFFEIVLQALLREIDFTVVKAVVIASPGYIKDDFFKYIMSEAERRSELKSFVQHKNQFLLAHSSSGHKHALDQVLSEESVQSRLSETHAARDTAMLRKFFAMLNESSEKAFYGYNHVFAAQEKGAIESLLITDSLFRSSEIGERKRYVNLVEECRASGASVHIFSSLHTSGEHLSQLTGVAALLRYGLPELDDSAIQDEMNDTAKVSYLTGVNFPDEKEENCHKKHYGAAADMSEASEFDLSATREMNDTAEAFSDMFSA